MITLDKDGYVNTFTVLLREIYRILRPELESSEQMEKVLLSEYSQYDLSTFIRFAKNYSVRQAMGGDIGGGLLTYHMARFVVNGKIVYKIRPKMLERIRNIEIDVPSRLLVIPHKEFMISLPFGSFKTKDGNLVNIFISFENFFRDEYKDVGTNNGVFNIINDPNVNIRGILRAIGIFYKNGAHPLDGTTSFFMLPVIDDVNVQDLFSKAMVGSDAEHAGVAKILFNLVLNFCCYLSTKDPDVQKVLGIVYKPASTNPKKLRRAALNNMRYGYDYYDVGRIYDTRYIAAERNTSEEGRKIFKRFKVRAHIRAQWYGPRTGGVPGTEQRLILIEEYEKGDDLQELGQKIITVGS